MRIQGKVVRYVIKCHQGKEFWLMISLFPIVIMEILQSTFLSGTPRENLDRTVLSEERDGLITRHPFCQKLIPEIEKRIEVKVKEERLRKQKGYQNKLGHEETSRYKKAFTILNEIAEVEAQAVINLGQKPTDQIEEPPNGFCLYPSSAQITVDKQYAFDLRLNTRIIRQGYIIKSSCTHPKLCVLTPEMQILAEDDAGIIHI